jgi:hypothetical protein
MPLLNPEIVRALATLSRGSEGIDAVMNSDHPMGSPVENRFTRALEDLQELAIQQQVPLAIVGGLAAIRYGYPAATQDIDIAVGKDQLARLLAGASRHGFKVVWESKSGCHKLMHGDVEINVVPEGGKAKGSSPTLIPGPAQMGVSDGLQYASIESWMELKISCYRQKDRAHVVEVLKKTNPATTQRIRGHLGQVHATYLARFEELLTEAIAEDQQEQERQ